MTGRDDIMELVGGDDVGLVERLVRWRRSRTAPWRCQGVEKSPAIQTTEVAPKATLSEDEVARRTHDSRTYGGETDLVCDRNGVRTESSPDHRE